MNKGELYLEGTYNGNASSISCIDMIGRVYNSEG